MVCLIFFTKRLNKRALVSIIIGAVLSIEYRIPIRIMLDNLGMPYCYPLVAALLAVLALFIVNNMLELKTEHLQ